MNGCNSKNKKVTMDNTSMKRSSRLVPRSDSTSDLFDLKGIKPRRTNSVNYYKRNLLQTAKAAPKEIHEQVKNKSHDHNNIRVKNQIRRRSSLPRSGPARDLSRVKHQHDRHSLLITVHERNQKKFMESLNVPVVKPIGAIQRGKDLTPYQRQRLKMKNQFEFSNGEVFTPRSMMKATSTIEALSATPSPIASPCPSPVSSVGSQVSISTRSTTSSIGAGTSANMAKTPVVENVPLKKKRLGHFFKRLIASKKDVDIVTEVTTVLPIVETVDPTDSNDSQVETLIPQFNALQTTDPPTLLDRLSKEWGTVHLNSLDNNRNGLVHSISILSGEADSETIEKRVKFANSIYVGETFSPEEYVRTDVSLDTATKTYNGSESLYGDNVIYSQEYGFVNEIKFELNEFKRQEMSVHMDSMKFTHFFR